MSNVLLGGAIGDALGVPFESKPAEPADYELLLSWNGMSFLGSEHHKLLPGQYSDDTQMSQMIAQSLVDNNGFNPDDLSLRYVDWIFSGRARGFGRTTLGAIASLFVGSHWSKSGIEGSYGNGTAMRAAPFGVFFRDDHKALIEASTIDAKITHNSDEAIAGSIAIAMATALICQNDTDQLLKRLCDLLPDSKVKENIHSLNSLVNVPSINPAQALRAIGTRADVRMTVPAALYCYLQFDNYHKAIESAIRAGFDTDTNASIVGALFGAKSNIKTFPSYMVEAIEDREKLIVLDSQLYNRSNKKYFER